MRSNVRFVWILLLAACGDDGSSVTGDARAQDAAIDVGLDACVPASGTPTPVYLNRTGATYATGADDAVANTSVVLDITRTLPAWPHDTTNWDAVKACITSALVPFNLTVTDTDPGTTPHHEIVFTSNFWGSGSGNVYSVSGLHCEAARPANGVAFVFGAPTGGNDPTLACENALSQLASDTTGLDHVTDCRDFLGGYATPCGAKNWIDAELPCGENATPRVCQCGGTTQNSRRTMRSVHGTTCN